MADPQKPLALHVLVDGAAAVPGMPVLDTAGCLEAWVRPEAPAREPVLFPLAHFDGRPLHLRSGQHPELGKTRLPSLGSVILPVGFDLVLFSRPEFGGAVRVLQQSVAGGMADGFVPASALVLDRRHLRQNHLVLFEGRDFTGAAQVVTLPGSWRPRHAGEPARPPVLEKVGSALVPPGVAMLLHRADGTETLHGNQATLPSDIERIDTGRDPGCGLDPALGVQIGRSGGAVEAVLVDENGFGLTLDKIPGARPDLPVELRFGGAPVPAHRWTHLALRWEAGSCTWLVNGRKVKSGAMPGPAGAGWTLGRGYAGGVAGVRAFAAARTDEAIRRERFADTAPSEPNAYLPFAGGLGAFEGVPGIVVMTADLPMAPTNAPLATSLGSKVRAGHEAAAADRRRETAHQSEAARAQADRHREQRSQAIRRALHIDSIAHFGFVRGNWVYHGSRTADGLTLTGNYYPTNLVQSDVAIVVDADGTSDYYRALIGGALNIRDKDNYLVAEASSIGHAPRALVCDPTGQNGTRSQDGKLLTGIYWIEEDGSLCRTWYLPGSHIAGKRQVLLASMPVPRVPVGEPGQWDMALDTVHQILYWTNGREIYQASVQADEPDSFELLVPNAVSPAPRALTVAPDGALVWLDGETETLRIRRLKTTQEQNPLPDVRYREAEFGGIEDLHHAPNPGRGVAVCRARRTTGGAVKTSVAYWVAQGRRSVEAAVPQGMGRYVDIGATGTGQPPSAALLLSDLGGRWDAAGTGTGLSFGGSGRGVLLEPLSLAPHRGLTARADLHWQGNTGSEPAVVYELGTAEGDHRLVLGIDADGLPRIWVRWGARLLTSPRANALGTQTLRIQRRAADDRTSGPQTVVWTLDPAGHATASVDGTPVWQQHIHWPGLEDDDTSLFERHALGVPGRAESHHTLDGATLEAPGGTAEAYSAFQGRIDRFQAWNMAVHDTERATEDVPVGFSRVSVVSRQHYLHAARLDGNEPPVALFPIDLDGGLSILSTLDSEQAQQSEAHAAAIAAANFIAAQRKASQAAVGAKLDAAHAALAQARQQADQSMSKAQADLDTARTQARTIRADAVQSAATLRAQGKQTADQTRADATSKASDIKQRASQSKRDAVARAQADLNAASARLRR